MSDQFPVLLLTGPRQVGKTTFLQRLCGNDRRYASLDDPVLRRLATEDPALFLSRHEPPVLIDEIQYAPALLPYLKMHVDRERRAGDFWLTGSQQFQMMKGMSETLAGRVGIINLLGFSARERHQTRIDVEPFLPAPDVLSARGAGETVRSGAALFADIWLGSFPALVAGPARDRDMFFSSYVQTYLQRDLRDLLHVGDDVQFLRFLKACAARTGGLLNLSDLARDADLSVPTARKWLSVLQASFQVYLLPPYFTNVTKRLVKSPKLYFLDTGLGAYLTEWSTAGTLESGAMAGPMLETWVFTELLKSWWHRMKAPNMYYFRDKDGKEIDFVFEKDGTLYPIEVKRAATPRREWLDSFSAFRRLGGKVGAGAVICLCNEVTPLDRAVDAIPAWVI